MMMMMMRRPAMYGAGLMLLAALALNGVLLASILEGASVLRGVEAGVGRALSCYELYNNRAVNDYFYPRHAWRGDLIYVFSLAAPLWLLASAALAGAASALWEGGRLRRALPLAAMGALMLALIALWPVVRSLSCALE